MGGYWFVAGWSYRRLTFLRGHLVRAPRLNDPLPDGAKTLCGTPIPPRSSPRTVRCRPDPFGFGDTCARCLTRALIAQDAAGATAYRRKETA